MGDEKVDDLESSHVTTKASIAESVAFVVNMMNEGKADPKQVYPGGGRYHGD